MLNELRINGQHERPERNSARAVTIVHHATGHLPADHVGAQNARSQHTGGCTAGWAGQVRVRIVSLGRIKARADQLISAAGHQGMTAPDGPMPTQTPASVDGFPP